MIYYITKQLPCYKKTVTAILICTTLAWWDLASAASYDYPITDPLAATIIGTPKYLEAEVPDTIKQKVYEIVLFPDRQIPDVLWYENALRFSLAYQLNKAPLVFIISGTGGAYNSLKMKFLQKAFYGAGFHVICLSSPTHPNFIVTASSLSAPGSMDDDVLDLYRVMQQSWEQVKDTIQVSEFHLTGYSLGGTQSAFIAKLDDKKKIFNFQKVLMINPSVNLYTSLMILDEMLEENLPQGKDRFETFFNSLMAKISQIYRESDYIDFNDDFFYQIYRQNPTSQEELSVIIGGSFRFSSANMLFNSDVMTNSGYIIPKNISLSVSDSLTDYYLVARSQSFQDYIDGVLFPKIKTIRPQITMQSFLAENSLKTIEDYLLSSNKIAVVTNKDDMILGSGDLDFLQRVFKTRATIYPIGGHCGNLTYKENIADIIDFFTKNQQKPPTP